MSFSNEWLIITACVAMVVSLALAWLASFIFYVKVASLKKLFPASHQLIKAHIDYLLMALLLVASFFMVERFQVTLPNWLGILACIGAMYNPS